MQTSADVTRITKKRRRKPKREVLVPSSQTDLDETPKEEEEEPKEEEEEDDWQDKTEKTVRTGKVVIGKFPCLHPGDFRVFEAVDVPELHHLVDCVVFPSRGARPHPDELSGSDLDGDMYLVIWDPDLVPSQPNRTAGDYTPPTPSATPSLELASDMRRFLEAVESDNSEDARMRECFVKYIINESLGAIANSWVYPKKRIKFFLLTASSLQSLHMQICTALNQSVL